MAGKSCLKRTHTAPASPSSVSPPAESPDLRTVFLPPDLEQAQPIREARRKSVTFSEDGDEDEVKEEVFYAEEYDRSPMKVTNKLNYKDMLELMELRLALPRVRPYGGRPRSNSLDSEGFSN